MPEDRIDPDTLPALQSLTLPWTHLRHRLAREASHLLITQLSVRPNFESDAALGVPDLVLNVRPLHRKSPTWTINRTVKTRPTGQIPQNPVIK